ncbi:hypothetical protein FRC04_001774 [Tulasnella sp. 424]|nr:hypothetical protein FRC04_001774 [Tulasnella sp. 424]KAG8968169.1 hypothetical protein FRC05_001646 [Tulasnella sp. 425]
MTYQLPNELKVQIIQHVDRRSLPTVLRVDSTFHDIAEARLYHTLFFKAFPSRPQLFEAATNCFNTIIGRPTAAAAVRCIGVDLYDWWHAAAEEFLEVFRTALPKVPNLVELEISDSNGFVTSEENIRKLPQGCLFSTLQHYFGPPGILDDIQSNVLKTLHIYSMGNSIALIQRSYSAAARLSGQTLRSLAIYKPEGDQGDLGEWESVFVEIPSHFPNLRYLSVEPWHTGSSALLDKLIPNIVRLPKLRLLRVSNSMGMQLLEQERHVKHLHAGCPQLRAITLIWHDEWMFCERLQTWISSREWYQLDEQLREEVDWRNYLEDPDREGFEYTFLADRRDFPHRM